MCGAIHETGNILMETRIRNGEIRKTFEPRTNTGWGLCAEHQQLSDNGYVALIEIDPERSPLPYELNSVYRTGELAFLKCPAAEALFDQKCDTPLVFIEPGVLDIIKERISTQEAIA